jgi:RNA polymerase sigma-70 factor (ECF subfamily)
MNETLSSVRRLFLKDKSEGNLCKDRNSEEDAGCVQRFKGGERAAFDRLVEKYQKDIYLICYSILCHREEAEEATMVAFERSFTKIWSLDDDRKFFPYLKQICANYCKDVIRKRMRDRIFTDIENTGEKDFSSNPSDPMAISIPKRPDEALEEKQDLVIKKNRRLAIRKALSDLRGVEREIVVLKIYRDLTFEEVASRLQISPNTAKTGFYRALDKLSKFNYLRELV